MSWPAARRPPISEYLLADDQPAMRMPITEIDDTASRRRCRSRCRRSTASGPNGTARKSRNVLMSTTIRRHGEQPTVGTLGEQVLLLEELADLGEELDRAVGPGLHRTEAALHEADGLEEVHVHDRAGGEEHRDATRRARAAATGCQYGTSRPRRSAHPSAVDVPEDEVEAGEDRDHVRHVRRP